MSDPLLFCGAVFSILVIVGINVAALSELPRAPKRRSPRNRGDEENTNH